MKASSFKQRVDQVQPSDITLVDATDLGPEVIGERVRELLQGLKDKGMRVGLSLAVVPDGVEVQEWAKTGVEEMIKKLAQG